MSSEIVDQIEDQRSSFVVRHPVAVLLVVGIGFAWVSQLASGGGRPFS
jgi:hypothetical protein